MESVLVGPAGYFFLFIPTVIFSLLILLVGVSIFAYLISTRMAPLIKAAPDDRFNQILSRAKNFFKIWLLQYRHPRYMVAGIIHILIFAGFITLSIRTISLVILGLSEGYVVPGFDGLLGKIYNVMKDYAATVVLIACIAAGVRRVIFKPERYSVPARYGGKSHTGEALFVLTMICTLMLSESFFEASLVAADSLAGSHTSILAPLSLVWFSEKMLSLISITTPSLQVIHIVSYYVHDLVFFLFLCFLPFGKHFHVITSMFNVFFMRTSKGKIKPVRYGITDEELDNLESFGVKKLEDFTWKHMLDFYSCADCGRCSDNCPANAVGRPLSPRFISIKGRDLIFKNYPVYPYSSAFLSSDDLIGSTYHEDEIWSCTTCGACEQECPMGIEYIDKIVDLRRGMVDEGIVPQSLQKPFKALEKRGNPWGKMEKKRSDWIKDLPENVHVKILGKETEADTLYFVDSIGSYDDRIQDTTRAAVTIISRINVNFGILGKFEKDSGNEIRRFGEEMLFQTLKNVNTEHILNTGAKNIITSDPHAFNALKNEYTNLPPVKHLTQFLADKVKSGQIVFKASDPNSNKIYTYHDPCYLGRHNDVYEAPRFIMNSIKELSRVEMHKNRDNSFCCGGGGLMLFYEPEEDQRMGVLRVNMALEAGANVIVTACPFCLINVEDAIKVAGLEGKMEVIDFAEFILEYME